MSDLKYSRVFFSLKVPKGGIFFLYTLVFLLAAAVVYAALGSIDEWARGTAVLRPEGEISVVRNETPGRIADRAARHGEQVRSGAVLWSVETGVTEAEIDRMESDLERLQTDRDELVALVQSLASGHNVIPDSLPHARLQFELLQLERRRLDLQVAGARRAYEREDQAPASLRRGEDVEELRRSYEIIQIEAEQYLPRELVSRREQLRVTESRIAELEQNLVAAGQRLSSATVRAPISGVLEYVRDFVPGDFVSTGEELAKIVPDQAERFRLIVEIPEREASDLRVGQQLILRFAGFSVAEYGSLRGEVVLVPQDAETGADGSSVFRLRGRLDQTMIYDRDGRGYPLRPGMTAEARVITRQTPIWRFLLQRLDFLL